MHMHINMNIYIYIYIYMYRYIYTYTYMHICINACMCIYICIYAYTYTCIWIGMMVLVRLPEGSDNNTSQGPHTWCSHMMFAQRQRCHAPRPIHPATSNWLMSETARTHNARANCKTCTH